MNIIIEGPDATGKSTLAEKLNKKYGMKIINSTSKTRNDLNYHLDLLDYQENTVFDRFHIGEMVYPKIYNRQGKLTSDEFIQITSRIVDNNDLLIVFYTSNLEVLKDRLIERGELNYLEEIGAQNKEFLKWIYVVNAYDYKNFIAVDVADSRCYKVLDKWIENHVDKNSINSVYRKVCRDLLEYGQPIKTQTGSRGQSKELVNYCFKVEDIENNIIDLKTRDTSYSYLAGETLWYWEGRNDVGFISKFGKLWEKISDDGKTNNSAYGYILKSKYGFDQIETIINLLKEQPTTRRAILNINEANPNVAITRDEMCTICLQYMIREDKLDCTVVMRSNDVIFGLTYDYTYFTQLQKYIAKRLNIKPGSYTHFAMSIHFYDKDVQLVKNIAYGTLERRKDRFDIDNLIKEKDFLIEYVDEHWEGKELFEDTLRTLMVVRGGNK
ncbi:MAG: hypothetical protein IJF87_05860 [Erysipelotrichaceae bacterium]|nr:hypothetical protein [Erysipelotrichaceae bacterium]